MTVLNREALLKKEELKIVKIELDKNLFVYVREMTGHEREVFEASLRKEKPNKKKGVPDYEIVLGDFRAKLAVSCVCDEGGKLIFKPTDYNQLSRNMGASKLSKIADIAAKLNAIGEEDKEELLKN